MHTTIPLRWTEVPLTDCLITYASPGSKPVIVPLADELTARQAAHILGISVRRIQSLCDEGTLLEGRDWRKKTGAGPNGHYAIKRSAIIALRTSSHGGGSK